MTISTSVFFPNPDSYRLASRLFRRLVNPTAVPILLAAFVLLQAPQGHTSELKNLTAAEIETLLAGNTAIGKWAGTNYRQFFAADGNTIYAQEGTRSSTGRWRVNRTKNVYESWWQRSDWAGYPVASDGKHYYWISHSLPPQAFEMVPGEQLVAKKKE